MAVRIKIKRATLKELLTLMVLSVLSGTISGFITWTLNLSRVANIIIAGLILIFLWILRYLVVIEIE